jgi:hypothetical protein
MRPQLNYHMLLRELAGSPGAPLPPSDPRPPYDSNSFRTGYEAIRPFAPELRGQVMDSYARVNPSPTNLELLQRR